MANGDRRGLRRRNQGSLNSRQQPDRQRTLGSLNRAPATPEERRQAGSLRQPADFEQVNIRNQLQSNNLFQRGLRQGIATTVATPAAVGSIVAGVAGFDKTSRDLADSAAETQEQGQKFSQLPTFRDVQEGDASLGGFTAGLLGSQAPVLASLFASGGAGGIIGRGAATAGLKQAGRTAAQGTAKLAAKREAAKKAVDATRAAGGRVSRRQTARLGQATSKFSNAKRNLDKLRTRQAAQGRRGQNIGAGTGAFGASFGLQSGEAIEILTDDTSGSSQQERALAALGGAVATGGLEFLPIMRLFNKVGLTRPAKKIIREELTKTQALGGIARGAGSQAGIEASTEVAQGVGIKAAHRLVNENIEFFDDESLEQYFEEGIAGAIIGGLLGGAASVRIPTAGPTETETENRIADSQLDEKKAAAQQLGDVRITGRAREERLDRAQTAEIGSVALESAGFPETGSSEFQQARLEVGELLRSIVDPDVEPEQAEQATQLLAERYGIEPEGEVFQQALLTMRDTEALQVDRIADFLETRREIEEIEGTVPGNREERAQMEQQLRLRQQRLQEIQGLVEEEAAADQRLGEEDIAGGRQQFDDEGDALTSPAGEALEETQPAVRAALAPGRDAPAAQTRAASALSAPLIGQLFVSQRAGNVTEQTNTTEATRIAEQLNQETGSSGQFAVAPAGDALVRIARSEAALDDSTTAVNNPSIQNRVVDAAQRAAASVRSPRQLQGRELNINEEASLGEQAAEAQRFLNQFDTVVEEQIPGAVVGRDPQRLTTAELRQNNIIREPRRENEALQSKEIQVQDQQGNPAVLDLVALTQTMIGRVEKAGRGGTTETRERSGQEFEQQGGSGTVSDENIARAVSAGLGEVFTRNGFLPTSGDPEATQQLQQLVQQRSQLESELEGLEPGSERRLEASIELDTLNSQIAANPIVNNALPDNPTVFQTRGGKRTTSLGKASRRGAAAKQAEIARMTSLDDIQAQITEAEQIIQEGKGKEKVAAQRERLKSLREQERAVQSIRGVLGEVTDGVAPKRLAELLDEIAAALLNKEGDAADLVEEAVGRPESKIRQLRTERVRLTSQVDERPAPAIPNVPDKKAAKQVAKVQKLVNAVASMAQKSGGTAKFIGDGRRGSIQRLTAAVFGPRANAGAYNASDVAVFSIEGVFPSSRGFSEAARNELAQALSSGATVVMEDNFAPNPSKQIKEIAGKRTEAEKEFAAAQKERRTAETLQAKGKPLLEAQRVEKQIEEVGKNKKFAETQVETIGNRKNTPENRDLFKRQKAKVGRLEAELRELGNELQRLRGKNVRQLTQRVAQAKKREQAAQAELNELDKQRDKLTNKFKDDFRANNSFAAQFMRDNGYAGTRQGDVVVWRRKDGTTMPQPEPTAAPKQEVAPTGTARVELPQRSRFAKKDQAKVDKSVELAKKKNNGRNLFIGRGSDNSSTNAYREAFGNRANVGVYTSNDVVFVSAEGSRGGRVKPNLAELGRAADAGATFVTDRAGSGNQAGTRSSNFNVGEKEVAEFLQSRGYQETNGNGVWRLQAAQQAAPQQPNAPRRRPKKQQITADSITPGIFRSLGRARPDLSSEARGRLSEDIANAIHQSVSAETKLEFLNDPNSPDARFDGETNTLSINVNKIDRNGVLFTQLQKNIALSAQALAASQQQAAPQQRDQQASDTTLQYIRTREDLSSRNAQTELKKVRAANIANEGRQLPLSFQIKSLRPDLSNKARARLEREITTLVDQFNEMFGTPPPSILLTDGNSSNRGQYSPQDHRIKLNVRQVESNGALPTVAQFTLLHELSHGLEFETLLNLPAAQFNAVAKEFTAWRDNAKKRLNEASDRQQELNRIFFEKKGPLGVAKEDLDNIGSVLAREQYVLDPREWFADNAARLLMESSFKPSSDPLVMDALKKMAGLLKRIFTQLVSHRAFSQQRDTPALRNFLTNVRVKSPANTKLLESKMGESQLDEATKKRLEAIDRSEAFWLERQQRAQALISQLREAGRTGLAKRLQAQVQALNTFLDLQQQLRNERRAAERSPEQILAQILREDVNNERQRPDVLAGESIVDNPGATTVADPTEFGAPPWVSRQQGNERDVAVPSMNQRVQEANRLALELEDAGQQVDVRVADWSEISTEMNLDPAKLEEVSGLGTIVDNKRTGRPELVVWANESMNLTDSARRNTLTSETVRLTTMLRLRELSKADAKQLWTAFLKSEDGQNVEDERIIAKQPAQLDKFIEGRSNDPSGQLTDIGPRRNFVEFIAGEIGKPTTKFGRELAPVVRALTKDVTNSPVGFVSRMSSVADRTGSVSKFGKTTWKNAPFDPANPETQKAFRILNEVTGQTKKASKKKTSKKAASKKTVTKKASKKKASKKKTSTAAPEQTRIQRLEEIFFNDPAIKERFSTDKLRNFIADLTIFQSQRDGLGTSLKRAPSKAKREGLENKIKELEKEFNEQYPNAGLLTERFSAAQAQVARERPQNINRGEGFGVSNRPRDSINAAFRKEVQNKNEKELRTIARAKRQKAERLIEEGDPELAGIIEQEAGIAESLANEKASARPTAAAGGNQPPLQPPRTPPTPPSDGDPSPRDAFNSFHIVNGPFSIEAFHATRDLMISRFTAEERRVLGKALNAQPVRAQIIKFLRDNGALTQGFMDDQFSVLALGHLLYTAGELNVEASASSSMNKLNAFVHKTAGTLRTSEQAIELMTALNDSAIELRRSKLMEAAKEGSNLAEGKYALSIADLHELLDVLTGAKLFDNKTRSKATQEQIERALTQNPNLRDLSQARRKRLAEDVKNGVFTKKMLKELLQNENDFTVNPEEQFVLRKIFSSEKVLQRAAQSFAQGLQWFGRHFELWIGEAMRARFTGNQPIIDFLNSVNTDVTSQGRGEAMFARKMRRGAEFHGEYLEATRNLGDEQQAALRDHMLGRKESTDPDVLKARQDIAKLMKKLRRYAIEAGLPLGDLGQNYVPWVFDPVRVSNRFEELAEDWARKRFDDDWTNLARERGVIKKNEQLSEVAKRELIRKTLNGIATENNGLVDTGDTSELSVDKVPPKVGAMFKRDLAFIERKGDTKSKELLGEMFSDEINATVATYIDQLVKRVEYTRTFGKNGEKFLRARRKAREFGADAKDIELMDKMANSVLGRTGLEVSPFWKALMAPVENVFQRPVLAENGQPFKTAKDAARVKREKQVKGRIIENPDGAGFIIDRAITNDPRRFRQTNALFVTYQNFTILGLAAFTNTADAAGILFRTGSINIAFRSYVDLAKETINSIRTARLPQKERQAQMTDLRKLATDLGIVEFSVTSDILGQTYGGNMMDGRAKRWNDKFFRWNGMEHLTRTMRLGAFAAGKRFLTSAARRAAAGDEAAIRELAEVDLEFTDLSFDADGEIELMSRGEADALLEPLGLTVAGARDRELSQANFDALTDTREIERQRIIRRVARDDRAKQALNRMVDESVLRPSPTQRPTWMNNPNWMLFSHLKGFMFTYHERVLRKAYTSAAQGRFGPMMAMSSYVGMIMAMDALRSVVQHGPKDDDEPWRPELTFAQRLEDAGRRSGVYGSFGFIADMQEAAEFNSNLLAEAGGPTTSQINRLWRAFVSGRTSMGSAFKRSLPGSQVLVDVPQSALDWTQYFYDQSGLPSPENSLSQLAFEETPVVGEAIQQNAHRLRLRQ